MTFDIDKELEAQLLSEREASKYRVSYDQEISFYDMVSHGELDKLQYYLDNLNATVTKKAGVLSDSDVSNRKYHTIIMTALISRFCIEAGMDISVSYALSDIFIRKLDKLTSVKAINEMSDYIAMTYCRKMCDIVKKEVVSRHIVLAIDYIRSHIQDNLTVESVAAALSLNSSYLSKLFKQEMGMTISRYIREQKIQIAQNMLRHLDESSLNIANYLGFSSQSHFIQVFKKSTGMTPEEYRKTFYHQSWMKGNKE